MAILTISQVDRGIYEALRRVALAGGYIPDVRAYPQTEAGRAAYRAAVKGWEAATGKAPVEVYGVASYKDRPVGAGNNIIVDRTGKPAGEIGAGMVSYTPAGNDMYNQVLEPERAYNINYQLSYAVVSAKYDRIISDIIGAALGPRKFLKGVDNEGLFTAQGYWVFYRGEVDTSGKDFMERTVNYLVKDVFLEPARVIGQVPALTDFKPDPVIGAGSEQEN